MHKVRMDRAFDCLYPHIARRERPVARRSQVPDSGTGAGVLTLKFTVARTLCAAGSAPPRISKNPLYVPGIRTEGRDMVNKSPVKLSPGSRLRGKLRRKSVSSIVAPGRLTLKFITVKEDRCAIGGWGGDSSVEGEVSVRFARLYGARRGEVESVCVRGGNQQKNRQHQH